MNFELFVALRYLRARRKQTMVSVITAISVVGIAAGVMALVIALALSTVFREDIQNKIVGATSHVNLLRLDGIVMRGYEPLAEKLREVPHVTGVAPAIFNQVFITGPSRNQGAVLKGIDPSRLLTGLGDPARLIEIEPQVFRLPLIAGRPNRVGEVVFREDNTGRVTHFFLANEPLAVYEKIDWYETSAFNVILLGTCILLFASMLLTRIVSRLDYGGSGRPCLAYRLLRCLSALNLVFLIGILITLSRQYVTTHEIIPFLMPLLMMALIATGLTIGVAAATFLVWKGRYWNLTARIHYTVVALAAAAFVWWMNYWNLLGLRLE